MSAKERLLVIDTCGETAGVAVSIGPEVYSSEDLARGSASAEIVAAVRRLLQHVGWRLAELDAVGVVSGPGSFTGMRAGLAAAKGLCEAAGLPLAAVSRLEVLADAAAVEDGLVALDAGRGELYVRDSRTAHEWLCAGDAVEGLAGERPLIVAEERVAERLAGCKPMLCSLHVGDAVGAVLRRLRAGGSDVSLVDANYVREESDIYRRPGETARASGAAVR